MVKGRDEATGGRSECPIRQAVWFCLSFRSIEADSYRLTTSFVGVVWLSRWFAIDDAVMSSMLLNCLMIDQTLPLWPLPSCFVPLLDASITYVRLSASSLTSAWPWVIIIVCRADVSTSASGHGHRGRTRTREITQITPYRGRAGYVDTSR
jgi:hypothetical protein